MSRSSKRIAKFVRELRGLEDEITLMREGDIPNSKKILPDLYWQRDRTSNALRALGVSIALVGNDRQTKHIPVGEEFQYAEERAPPKKEPSKWKKYGAYAVAAGLILLAIGGFYVGGKALEKWTGFGTTPNEIHTKRRDEKNNTTEYQPEIPQNQTQQNQTHPQLPINGTPTNQTPINTTPQPNAPDYLKWASGIFTGDTFMGRYEIADAEHNADGNYSMKLKDSKNRTVFEIDLNDSEGKHNFQFPTEGLTANEPYFVEILRNETLAHEPFKFIIPNSPPSVSVQASARLGINNESRIVEYSARMRDDRGLAEAGFYLFDDNGSLVQQIRKEELKGRGMLFNGLHTVDENLKAGKYHILAKVFDSDGSESDASADVDIPEIPIPPPPPYQNIPPQITSAKMYIDKSSGRAAADIEVYDPDDSEFSIDQNFTDKETGQNLVGTARNWTTINGNNIHEEFDLNAGDTRSVYDWEIGVSDKQSRTSRVFHNVWNWMRDLAGYWKFDEADGETINDSAKENNGFTWNSPQFVNGKIGNALKFDGINDYAQIPHRDLYNQKDFSLSLWFNAEELKGRHYATLFNKDGWGGLVIATYNGPDKETVRILGGESGEHKTLGETPGLSDNTWYFLTFSYDSASKKAKTYLNGDLVDEQNITGTLSLANPAAITFGAPFEGQSHFKGRMDDLRFYGRVLSSRQVKAIYEDI